MHDSLYVIVEKQLFGKADTIMAVYWIYGLISCTNACSIYCRPLVAASADICRRVCRAGFAVGAFLKIHT